MYRGILLLFLTHLALAQEVSTGFAEKSWALCHPLAALRIKNIYHRCMPVYDGICRDSLLDHYSAGGSLDAFRHCFFMAAFAQHVRGKTVRRLGKLHERRSIKSGSDMHAEFGEVADSVYAVMDLYNNDIGIALGKSHRHLLPEALAALVIQEIKAGNAYKLKRDKNGFLVSCKGEAIYVTSLLEGVRAKPCLIKSNEE